MCISSSAGRSQMMMMIFGMEGSDLFRWKRICICSLTVSPQVRSVTFKMLKCNLCEVLDLSSRQKVDLLRAMQQGGGEELGIHTFHSIFSFFVGETSAWPKGVSVSMTFSPSFL